MAKEHNDYFQWCSNEAIAVGGSGGCAAGFAWRLVAGVLASHSCRVLRCSAADAHCGTGRRPDNSSEPAAPAVLCCACRYALWLDADLTRGLSRNCTTFGNSSLAGQEEFAVGSVELWGLS